MIRFPSRPRRLNSWQWTLLAERMGFEPMIRVSPYNGLANRRLQPLGHLSDSGRYARACPTLTRRGAIPPPRTVRAAAPADPRAGTKRNAAAARNALRPSPAR